MAERHIGELRMTPTPIVLKIIVDSREPNKIIKLLEARGMDIEIQTLEVGDYVISNRLAFERKTPEDALNSFIGDEKLKILRQCKDLADCYSHPLLIIEGDLSDLFIRNIHPGAIWGMLRSILWNGCPIAFTYNAEGTAKKLYEMALEEQAGVRKPFCSHGSKTKRTVSEQKEYIVSAIPDIGAVAARELLKRFGSVEKVMCASIEELMEVPGIGAMTAKAIKKIVSTDWEK